MNHTRAVTIWQVSVSEVWGKISWKPLEIEAWFPNDHRQWPMASRMITRPISNAIATFVSAAHMTRLSAALHSERVASREMMLRADDGTIRDPPSARAGCVRPRRPWSLCTTRKVFPTHALPSANEIGSYLYYFRNHIYSLRNKVFATLSSLCIIMAVKVYDCNARINVLTSFYNVNNAISV